MELIISLKTIKAFKKIQVAMQCRRQDFILGRILKAQVFFVLLFCFFFY